MRKTKLTLLLVITLSTFSVFAQLDVKHKNNPLFQIEFAGGDVLDGTNAHNNPSGIDLGMIKNIANIFKIPPEILGYILSNQYYYYNRKTRDPQQTSTALKSNFYEINSQLLSKELNSYLNKIKKYQKMNRNDCDCSTGMQGVNIPKGKSSSSLGDIVNNFESLSDLKSLKSILSESLKDKPERKLYTSIGYAQIQIIKAFTLKEIIEDYACNDSQIERFISDIDWNSSSSVARAIAKPLGSLIFLAAELNEHIVNYKNYASLDISHHGSTLWFLHTSGMSKSRALYRGCLISKCEITPELSEKSKAEISQISKWKEALKIFN